MAMDPALYWNDRELVRRAEGRLATMAGPSLSLWLTAADTPEIRPAVDSLAAVLRDHAPSGLRWTYDPRYGEEHTTIFRATKADAFRWALWEAE